MNPRAWWGAVALLWLVGCGSSATKGPAVCTPGARTCHLNAVHTCTADGSAYEWTFACPAGEVCSAGACAAFRWPGDTADADAAADAPEPADGDTGGPRVRDVDRDAPPHTDAGGPDGAAPDAPPADSPTPPDSGPPNDVPAPDLAPDLGPDGVSPELGPELTAPDGGRDAAPDLLPDGGPDLPGPFDLEPPADLKPRDQGPSDAPVPDGPPPFDAAPDVSLDAADAAVELGPGDLMADEAGPLGDCGNGLIEAGEGCEPGLPIGVTCEPGQVGVVGCTADCQVDLTGCATYHMLTYSRVLPPQPSAIYRDDFIDAAWAPDGGEALLLTSAGGVLGYDPAGRTLSVVADLDPGRPRRIAWRRDGLGAYLAGYEGSNGRVWYFDAASRGVTPVDALTVTGIPFTSMRREPDSDRAVLTAYANGTPVDRLYLVDTLTGTFVGQGAYPEFAGVLDAMWGPADPLPFVVTSDGWNGAESHSWYPDLEPPEAPTLNDFRASFGNPGQAGWRPGGSYGILVGTSSNVLYVYQHYSMVSWSWESRYLTAAGSMSAIGWHPTGSRALVMGRSGGTPIQGKIYEIRPIGPLFSGSQTVNQFIPAFGSDPYMADSNTYLWAAAWRPVPCDEGLLVGDSTGYGLLIHFVDPDDAACL